MTREEAYKLFWDNDEDILGTPILTERGYTNCVDEIYYHFENRSCKDCTKYDECLLRVEKLMKYCSEWEKKYDS